VIEDFLNTTEGPLLWIVFILFALGILSRFVFFICKISESRRTAKRNPGISHILIIIARAVFPFHNAFIKKPFYATLRYIFHLSLVVVPIWLAGHISLWEESRFEWAWTPIPDNWADGMTLLLLGICACFFVRRIVFKEIRQNSSISDYVLIILAALPFLTGYFLTHGSLETIPFFETYMWHFHVLSGEAMLLTIVFLFYRTRLNPEKCVGCAACESNCPTETLESADKERQRIFTYSHYQCICCGSCVCVCPEDAAEIRHEIGVGNFFQVFSKKDIGKIDLATCEQCGVSFAPTPQITKLEGDLRDNDVEMALLNCCNRCKKLSTQKSYLFPTT